MRAFNIVLQLITTAEDEKYRGEERGEGSVCAVANLIAGERRGGGGWEGEG